MEIFLYTIIFIIGTLFGSFYTLAVHRIPKRQDITHTHSYCPNCNHKLGFFELIPVFSYILLGAKCKHCKKKIRPRYFLLEMSSGVLFVLFTYILEIVLLNINYASIILFAFSCLYLTFLFLTIGIDKENRKIEKPVLAYGIVISLMYIIYLYILGNINIYRYVMYLTLFIIWLLLDSITLRKYAKNSYVNGIICMLLIMFVFTSNYICYLTCVMTLIAISIYILIFKIKNLKSKNKKIDKEFGRNISIGFILGISNIISLFLVLLLNR